MSAAHKLLKTKIYVIISLYIKNVRQLVISYKKILIFRNHHLLPVMRKIRYINVATNTAAATKLIIAPPISSESEAS